jgi:hypothetical protein
VSVSVPIPSVCVPITRPVLRERALPACCEVRGRGAGASRVGVAGVGLAVVGNQAVWRYSLMSPLHVACRRIGWPGRYSTASAVFGAR